MRAPNPPRATVRLQFHAGFTLDDARATVPYYAELGISHVYASPLLAARAGSSHGYDVVDPTRINPELGGIDALRRLVGELRAHAMGLILDIVPNHMAASVENPWWRDVLEWGRDSRHADYFDIDWEPPDPELRGRVLVPTLSRAPEALLADGEFHLRMERGRVEDEYTGRIQVVTGDQCLPLAASAYAGVLGAVDGLAGPAQAFQQAAPGGSFERALAGLARDSRTDAGRAAIEAALQRYSSASVDGRRRLGALLSRQPYLLAPWSQAWQRINWRRFFDINELVAIRPDRPQVFEATHALVLDLYAKGLIDGLRIDHIDGLVDPRGYCRQLRGRLQALEHLRPADAGPGPAYLVVEKILAPDEPLRGDWPVDGTTGYEFMDQVAAVLHDPAGAAPLARLWEQLAGPRDYGAYVRDARRQMTLENFAADLEATVRALHAVAGRTDGPRPDREALRGALVELIVHFPVYRTYVEDAEADRADVQILARAARAAEASGARYNRQAMALLLCWLSGQGPAGAAAEVAHAIARFQQLTPPVAAKAIEDTTFYRYGRLLSRNEVGAEPDVLALGIDAFHGACSRRQRETPHTLLTTATHDHKRGEDARARLVVLSEMPGLWADRVHAWIALNASHRSTTGGDPAPDPVDEAILYQTLLGAWPLDLDCGDAPALHALADRVATWQQKALREAKRHSSWTNPDAAYERACERFLRACLSPDTGAAFIRQFSQLVQSVAPAGAINGLGQSLLRMTTPGLPDLYQGTEFWDFSLVDPDNRRAVDYPARVAGLAGDPEPAALFTGWSDGRLKQRLVARVLATRRALPDLFAHGAYRPLPVRGPRADHAIAFVREHRDAAVAVLATRRPLGLHASGAPERPRIPPERWAGTEFQLPHGRWHDVLGDRPIEGGRVAVGEALQAWPVALLVRS